MDKRYSGRRQRPATRPGRGPQRGADRCYAAGGDRVRVLRLLIRRLWRR